MGPSLHALYAGAFAQLSETPARISRMPPKLGEHNDQIYMGELGLSRSELDRLKCARAI